MRRLIPNIQHEKLTSACHESLDSLRRAIFLFMRVIFPKTGTHFWVTRSRVRLDTLVRIRWLAIAGQMMAVVFVGFGLGFGFDIAGCAALIVLSVLLNLYLRWKFRSNARLGENGATVMLGYDVLQLALLLFLTGGLQNPFSILLVVPVIISATIQTVSRTLALGFLCVAAATVLVFEHRPLPWYPGETLQLPLLFITGMWVAIVSSLAFTAIYSFRVADEGRKLAEALTATELVLQREQHISALDGLAAAAAHELGTPLATISLVSKEMLRDIGEHHKLGDDLKLLNSQAQRCREILSKLTSLSKEDEQHMVRLPLSSMMEQVAGPHREIGVALQVELNGAAGEPVMHRNPAILYGLGNLVENAVDFANDAVKFSAGWSDDQIIITICDDGPGLTPDVLERIGEPFMTTRNPSVIKGDGDDIVGREGLGLGVFIAKTLLERSGASLFFANRTDGKAGATVSVVWPRSAVDISPTSAQIPEPTL